MVQDTEELCYLKLAKKKTLMILVIIQLKNVYCKGSRFDYVISGETEEYRKELETNKNDVSKCKTRCMFVQHKKNMKRPKY